MSRNLKRLYKNLLKLESKCKCVKSLVETSSIVKTSLDYEPEESIRRQRSIKPL